MSLLNPWVILAIVLAIGGAGVGGYFKGHSDAAATCQVEKDTMVNTARAKQDKEAAKATDVSVKLEDTNAKSKIVYRTITKNVDKIVEKPVYRELCFDDDGLRSANAALLGSPEVTGKSDKPVPAPDSTGGRDKGVSTPKDSGSR